MSEAQTEYWKQRCLLAEKLIEQPPANPIVDRDLKPDGLEPDDVRRALNLLHGARIDAGETVTGVVTRLMAYAADRLYVMNTLRVAGYEVESDPEVHFAAQPVVELLLRDLRSGRSTISFLSNPPKVSVERLPIGCVFVHDGRLLEVKREPTVQESQIICYLWNRDERPTTVDRKQLVAPLGRVTFDDRRKGIKLGLLELKDEALVVEPQIETKQPKLFLSSGKD